MATEKQIESLEKHIEQFRKIDRDKLLRPNLGEESLEPELRPRIEFVDDKLKLAPQLAQFVTRKETEEFINVLAQLNSELEPYSNYDNTRYVSEENSFLNSINKKFDEFQQKWTPFVIAKIESSNILEDNKVTEEQKDVIKKIQDEAQKLQHLYSKLTEDLKKEGDRVVEQAGKEADKIKERARQTAAKISVKDAQEQFRLAQRHHLTQVIVWTVLSFAALVGFFVVALSFYKEQISTELKWQVIYYTAIRLTILGAVGATATFFLRIFRAHLHMYQHNLHRRRLANSMAAFVEAASSEQRDLILAHLVDAIASFGSSGLLQKEDDSIHVSKMILDSVPKK